MKLVVRALANALYGLGEELFDSAQKMGAFGLMPKGRGAWPKIRRRGKFRSRPKTVSGLMGEKVKGAWDGVSRGQGGATVGGGS